MQTESSFKARIAQIAAEHGQRLAANIEHDAIVNARETSDPDFWAIALVTAQELLDTPSYSGR